MFWFIFEFQPVSQIMYENDKATGVVLQDGTELKAKVVMSNATPKITFLDLLPKVHVHKMLTAVLPLIVERLKSLLYDSTIFLIYIDI